MPYALIVAHGQPSDPNPAEAALARYAAEVAGMCDDVTVTSATLAAPGALEAKLQDLPDDTVVFPLFMAKGWFVTSALPKRLGAKPLRVLDPLGTEAILPSLIAAALGDAVTDLKWVSSTTDIVLAAHGSGRSRNPSKVARDFAKKLEELTDFHSIRVGFVEEPPSIAEAAQGTGAKALCLPFFACTGGHVLEDIPQELDRAAFKGRVLPVVGELPRVKRQIANVLSQAFEGT
ncbi:sirohydrochlorin cobaltochelatase [Ruegeria sp. THAF57]|uniref:CbiX/SirB N-terminal domain-containing protein n=1 Tax=Ruegeria sp. THAF57 TaxID=2744555 RepID=UPI0015DD9A04|nr:CbiX/SirB N-terminal domain-containing protein [Ruegeria sp. THAF57]CAD0183489.1 sirohydrochlorin cobaltochelatase [Ruegeria sp. THAF57]